MDADEILDVLERKAKGAFIREIGIYDQDVVSSSEARREAIRKGIDNIPDLVAGSLVRRIDGLDFSSTKRTAFEVKISRGDWRRESEEKRRAWRSVTHRYVYVSPESVIPVDEVPSDCGLWWIYLDQVPGTDRKAPRIQVMKKAPNNPEPKDLPWRVTMNLCYREQKLRTEIKRAKADYQSERRRNERLLADLREVVPGYAEYSKH